MMMTISEKEAMAWDYIMHHCRCGVWMIGAHRVASRMNPVQMSKYSEGKWFITIETDAFSEEDDEIWKDGYRVLEVTLDGVLVGLALRDRCKPRQMTVFSGIGAIDEMADQGYLEHCVR